MDFLTPSSFFFDLPLYSPITISNENSFNAAVKLFQCNYSVEAYNPSLKQETTYKISRGALNTQYTVLDSYLGFNSFELICVRNKYNIKVYVILEKENNAFTLKKVGQYPSIADLHISKIREYDKVLERPMIREITKAVGLAANGVGIGSFVYLRRVFEFLIEDAHQTAKAEKNWNEEEYAKSRIVEKIELLKHHLPGFLVSNKSMYGILSKGIHSLEEDECLAYFDALKVGIELILDEKVDQQNRMKKIQEAQTRLSSIAQNVAKR